MQVVGNEPARNEITKINLKNMNEAETRAELIDPALAAAGWGKVEGSRVRYEVIGPSLSLWK